MEEIEPLGLAVLVGFLVWPGFVDVDLLKTLCRAPQRSIRAGKYCIRISPPVGAAFLERHADNRTAIINKPTAQSGVPLLRFDLLGSMLVMATSPDPIEELTAFVSMPGAGNELVLRIVSVEPRWLSSVPASRYSAEEQRRNGCTARPSRVVCSHVTSVSPR